MGRMPEKRKKDIFVEEARAVTIFRDFKENIKIEKVYML
jgi:hypothetical protein